MEPLNFTSGTVFQDRGRLYTISSCPGKRVYGERLFTLQGTEYREWDPRRSKLSAYLTVGGKEFPFRKDSKILYLGASSGTTPRMCRTYASRGRCTAWSSPRGCSGNWWVRARPVRT